MLTRRCANTRIPSCFSLKGSRASVQKMRGVTSPQAHHKVSEESRNRFQLGVERPGSANTKPRMVQSSAAEIQRAQWLFRCHLANAVSCLMFVAKVL